MWRGEKSCYFRDSNFDPSAVQPVAGRYTDCAIVANSVGSIIVTTEQGLMSKCPRTATCCASTTIFPPEALHCEKIAVLYRLGHMNLSVDSQQHNYVGPSH
jgi:hypothetical protein